MKYEITAIEFDHDSAIEFIEIIKKRIEAVDTDFLNGAGYVDEFDVEDGLGVEMRTEFFPEEDNNGNPERTVRFNLKLFNKEGKRITYTVAGNLVWNEIAKRYQRLTPINIEEEVIKYFQI